MKILLDECLPRRLLRDLSSLHLCIIVIRVVNSRYETIQPLVSDLLIAVENAKLGHLMLIGE